jgi:hypothetical protein
LQNLWWMFSISGRHFVAEKISDVTLDFNAG